MGKIVIQFTEMPDSDDPKSMIRWFCIAFGLCGAEGGGIEEKILGRFTDAAWKGNGITSSELGEGIDLSRSTVIYHLNRFIDSGLVVKRGRRYYLRASEMHKAIEEIEYDIEREMKRMMDIAMEFDRITGMRARRTGKRGAMHE